MYYSTVNYYFAELMIFQCQTTNYAPEAIPIRLFALQLH